MMTGNQHELRIGFVALDGAPMLRLFTEADGVEVTLDCLSAEQARRLADQLQTLPSGNDSYTVTLTTGAVRGLSSVQLTDLIVGLRDYAWVLDDCRVAGYRVAMSPRLIDLAKRRLANQLGARAESIRADQRTSAFVGAAS